MIKFVIMGKKNQRNISNLQNYNCLIKKESLYYNYNYLLIQKPIIRSILYFCGCNYFTFFPKFFFNAINFCNSVI